MINKLLDLLFPIKCCFCQKPNFHLCPECLNKIPSPNKPIIEYSNNPLNGLLAVASYSHPISQRAIHCFKYDYIKALAKPLAQMMISQLASSGFNKESTILIPVPLHKRRLRWRGFNQAELLAREIASQLSLKICTGLLIRKKHAPAQAQIKSNAQRKSNIKNAFAINPQLINSDLRKYNLWLVDDVATSQATLQECASVLRYFKPKSIWAIVLAKGG